MRERFSPVVLAGSLAGLLFFLHAMVPYSHAWPLLWPVAGGALAVHLAARRRTHAPSIARSLAGGAAAGGVAGLLFVVLTAAALQLLSRPAAEPVARWLGATEPVAVSPAVLLSLVYAAAIGALLAAAAGTAMHPLVRSTGRA